MSSKDKEKKNEGTSQVPVQPQEKVDSSPQINETNATTEPTAITKHDLTNDPIAQQLSNKPKAIATPTQESYAIAPPPEQPDYDAIEKGVEDKDKEQRKADAKRQRSRAIVSAVGDGLTALSNLYFTTQYAPNMNTGRGELSAKNVERWDKYVKARDAKLAEYKKTAIERADKKYENDYTRWKDEATFAQNKRKQDLAEIEAEFERSIKRAKDEREAEAARLDNLYKQGLIDLKYWETENEKVKNKYAEAVEEANLYKIKAQGRQADSAANLNRERRKTEKIKQIKIRSGSGSNAKDGPTITVRYDANGNATYQISGKNVTKAQVDALVKEYGLSSSDINGDDSEDNSTYNWGGEKYSDNLYVVQKGKKQNEKPY